jgi:hypothetical protein
VAGGPARPVAGRPLLPGVLKTTRLGYDGPKGEFPVTPVKNKPLFQVFAEQEANLRRSLQPQRRPNPRRAKGTRRRAAPGAPNHASRVVAGRRGGIRPLR